MLKVPFVLAEPLGQQVKELVDKKVQEGAVEVFSVKSLEEAGEILEKFGGAMVISCIQDQSHVVQAITLLKLFSKLVQQKRFALFLTSTLVHPEILEALEQYGCAEVLREPASPKSLDFKLNRFVQALSSNLSQNSENQPSAKIEMAAPLSLKDDVWLYHGDSAHWIMGRWSVRLEGPIPFFGKWQRIENVPLKDLSSEEEIFVWNPESHAEKYFKENGKWFFCGSQKPERLGKDWVFTGKNPCLAYGEESEPSKYKFQAKSNRDLVIAKNSESAQVLLPQLVTEPNLEVLEGDSHPGNPLDLKIEKSIEAVGDLTPESQKELQEILTESKKEVEARSQMDEKGDPNLKPISVAFLVSELMVRTELSQKQRLQKYCHYLSRSCEDLRVEVWQYQEKKWSFGNSEDGTPGRYQWAVEDVGLKGEDGLPAKAVSGEVLVSEMRRSDGKLTGALVLASEKNKKGISRIPVEYIVNVASLSSGLLY